MKARKSAAILAAALFLGERPVQAAEVATAAPLRVSLGMAGAPVRLTTTTGMRFEGRLSSTEDGGLTIVDERGVALTLERSQIARVELGRRRGRAQGALRGALWGGAVAALAGVSVYAMEQGSKREDGLCGDLQTGITTCTKASEIPGVVLGGALIGVAIGSAWPGLEWKPTDSDAFRVAVSPVAGGGVGARATIRF